MGFDDGPARSPASESAITARPADRCPTPGCGRLYVNGGCFYHPPGHSEVERVKVLYRAALEAHAALGEGERAAGSAWVAGMDVV